MNLESPSVEYFQGHQLTPQLMHLIQMANARSGMGVPQGAHAAVGEGAGGVTPYAKQALESVVLNNMQGGINGK